MLRSLRRYDTKDGGRRRIKKIRNQDNFAVLWRPGVASKTPQIPRTTTTGSPESSSVARRRPRFRAGQRTDCTPRSIPRAGCDRRREPPRSSIHRQFQAGSRVRCSGPTGRRKRRAAVHPGGCVTNSSWSIERSRWTFFRGLP